MARKIKAKQILKLRANGLSINKIVATGMSKTSVKEVFDRADSLGITYSDICDEDDAKVYELIFPNRNKATSIFEQPNWEYVHEQMAKVGVTLKLLHSEYCDFCIEKNKIYMGYNKFCIGYRDFTVSQNITSRVGHKAGRIVEVDWSGPTMELVDPLTGEISKVYLFVATLPFSRYTYVEPTLDMKQDSWLNCHVNMFEYFGGSTPCIVADNLKTAVIKHPREGEVVLSAAYEEMALHYSAAVLPARVRKPKDKPSVEGSVGNIATSIIARLRNQTFCNFDYLKQEIRRCLDDYNKRPFQKRKGSRKSSFELEEKPLLCKLPKRRYEICKWYYKRKVQKNCHVAYNKNYYSVPYHYLGSSVDLRVTKTIVEIYLESQRIATHNLFPDYVAYKYSTIKSHMPKDRQYSDWNAKRIRDWALRIGPATTKVIDAIFLSVKIEEQAYVPALTILKLVHKYSAKRLEKACQIALDADIYSPRHRDISPILKSGQDKVQAKAEALDEGGYVRGTSYYGKEI